VPLLVSKLNGNKILIPGNHDKCWQKTDPANRWFSHYIDAGFSSIEQQMTLDIAAEEQVMLNHLPYRNSQGA
jgi:calcineurin-like phosphoesterase family protein